MRKERTDFHKILTDSSTDNQIPNENDMFEALLPNSVDNEPQMIPQMFAPNTRMLTTLMKGYMKAGCISDTIRMLEPMTHQEDRASHSNLYNSYICICDIRSINRAGQVLAEMTRIAIPANIITYNTSSKAIENSCK